MVLASLLYNVILKQAAQPTARLIKEMKKQLIVERNMQRAIGRELEYLTSIRSPFVLEVYATSRDANSIYIITEFLPGGDFFDYLASKGKLNEVTHVNSSWRLCF